MSLALGGALLYTLFIWWFSTGLVLLLVLRRPGALRLSVIGAALLFPVCLVVLAKTATASGTLSVYAAFTAATALWGTQEIAFLSGAVTGPHAAPCPAGARGLDRFRCALGAILYHEVALMLTGLAALAATAGGSNRVGVLAFGVLWAMRVSAKLNLFLGVPQLNDEVLPAPVVHLRSYFRRGPVNAFFPVALVASLLLAGLLVALALDPVAEPAAKAGYALVAALVALAILEHAFMLVPLPINRLWRWSTGVAL